MSTGSPGHNFLGHYADQMIACDFLTVETVRLRTLYILFFIGLGSRRVHLAGCTAHPTSEWVTQQARNLVWDIGEARKLQNKEQAVRFLIHDRDAKFTAAFNTVLKAEGIMAVLTPYRCPKANAFAERWVRTVREECLHLLINSESHLRGVLAEYLDYYNQRRPHQGIAQRAPVSLSEQRAVSTARAPTRNRISRREVLGGIIHDYFWTDCHAA